MNKKYLLLDCNYLCHRAKHTTGGLSYDGDATGVMYGFLKALSTFQDLFGTSRFVFCWDSNTSKRKEIYPVYKANREREYTDEEKEFDKQFRRQMKKLRTRYLPMIGFKNVFVQCGYEGDDVIASIALHLSNDDEAVIISNDHDLYQCIAHNISFFNPQKCRVLTLQGFKKKYGIKPHEWALVKAIAGCTTDNVAGIYRVGEKTAIKYLQGRLSSKCNTWKDITNLTGKIIFDRNFPLVKLPMRGTQRFSLRRDRLSEQGWKDVVKILGMKSIRDRFPFGRKIRTRRNEKYEKPDDGYISLGEEQAMRSFGI